MKEGFNKAVKTIKLILTMSRSLDVNAIRQKYGFTANRIVRINFVDIDRHFTFYFSSGGTIDILERFRDTIIMREPDVQIYIKSLCTLKHLRNGTKAYRIHGTSEKVVRPYSPLDAWKFDDIEAYGDTSTNDVIAFARVLREIMEKIDSKELSDIIGGCEHD